MNVHLSDSEYRWYKDPEAVQKMVEELGEDAVKLLIDQADKDRLEGIRELMCL